MYIPEDTCPVELREELWESNAIVHGRCVGKLKGLAKLAFVGHQLFSYANKSFEKFLCKGFLTPH